jgi:hypothetical protein
MKPAFALFPALLIACTLVLTVLAAPASAYVGPGAGLSAIGSVLALLAAIVAAIFGFLWYPIKRMLRKKRAQRDEAGGK